MIDHFEAKCTLDMIRSVCLVDYHRTSWKLSVFNILHETSSGAEFGQFLSFREIWKISDRIHVTSFSVVLHQSEKIDLLSTFLMTSTFFQILIRLQVSPIPPRLTLYTCPRLLRGDWAVWRKELCEKLSQWFHRSKWKTLSTFLFLCPSDLLSQSNGPSKNTFSTFTKIEHHNFSNFVSFTIRFVSVSSIQLLFKSRPQKRPMSQREFSSIISNIKRIRNANFSVSLFAPFTVVVH